MRKIVLLAATGAALIFGAVSAEAFPSVSPEASPYAVLVPESVQPPASTEGRAALVGGETGVWSIFGASPTNAAPTPHDHTFYSHAR